MLAGCDRPRARYAGISSTSTTESGAEAVRGFHSVRNYRPTAAPVRLQIPAIGVDTGLMRLGKLADGTVDVPGGPHKWDQAGWYAGEGGSLPGDPGSAVILGHVDSKSGPAVFYRLRELRRGDQIKVTTADGTVYRFAIDRLEQYPKARFPPPTSTTHPDPEAAAGHLRRQLRPGHPPPPRQRDRLRQPPALSRSTRSGDRSFAAARPAPRWCCAGRTADVTEPHPTSVRTTGRPG